MKKLIFMTAVITLVIVNLNLVFSSGKSVIELSLDGIEALANRESAICSVCGGDAYTCNCDAAITCSYPDCWRGTSCHEGTGNPTCPCRFIGDRYMFCI